MFGILGEFGSNDQNAVRNFQLEFFSGLNGTGSQIGAAFNGQHTTPQALQFFALGSYVGVRSFRFTPLSAQISSTRVEWSEVQFDGAASAVPARHG